MKMNKNRCSKHCFLVPYDYGDEFNSQSKKTILYLYWRCVTCGYVKRETHSDITDLSWEERLRLYESCDEWVSF